MTVTEAQIRAAYDDERRARAAYDDARQFSTDLWRSAYKAGMSQPTIARAAGATLSAVSDRIRGRTYPKTRANA